MAVVLRAKVSSGSPKPKPTCKTPFERTSRTTPRTTFARAVESHSGGTELRFVISTASWLATRNG